MLDHNLENASARAEPCRTGATPLSSRRVGLGGEFIGLAVWVRWEGNTDALAAQLRRSASGMPFSLHSLACRDEIVWQRARPRKDGRTPAVSSGPVVAVYACEPEARARAEAHIPRLLESVGVRVTWVETRKLRGLPSVTDGRMHDGPGDWSSLPIAKSDMMGELV